MATNKYIHQLSGITNPNLTGFTVFDDETATYKVSLSNLRQNLVDSGSHYFTGSQVINGNLTVSGSITAQQYVISSSITNITNYNLSGSSIFGNSLDDTHQFTGSVNITGSFTINGTTFSSMTSGTSGTSGTNGSSGTSGTSGTNGSSGTSGTSGQSSILGLTWKKGDFSNEGYFGIGPSNQYLSVDYFLFNNTSWDYNNNSVSSTGNATNFLNGISFGTIFHFTKIDQPQNFGIYRVTGMTTGSTSTTVYVEDLAGNSLQGIQSGETYNVFYTNSGDSIFAETGSFWATTNDVQVTGSFDVEGPITATYFNSTDTNTAENYKVGDNVWLGDVGELNTLVVKGINDSSSAFIKFGYGASHQHPYLGHVSDENANVLSVVADTTKFSNAIIVGSGSLVAGNPEMVHVYSSGSYNIAYFVGETDTYSQINVKNISSAGGASSDIVATADNGTEDLHYVNMGINSSGYDTPFSIGYQNDAYLYNAGRDLYIGTIDAVDNNHGHVHLFTSDSWDNPQISILNNQQIGFNTSGVTSGYTYEFSGSVKLNNDLKVDGSITTSYLNVGSGSGDEGGEIFLAKPITNTTITGSGVIIDLYRNRIRIFEQGGSTRGAFLDVTRQSNTVSSEIVTSPNLFSIQTITSASYAALTPVSGTLYIIID